MSTDKNVQTVKDFFAAIGCGDREALLAPARRLPNRERDSDVRPI